MLPFIIVMWIIWWQRTRKYFDLLDVLQIVNENLFKSIMVNMIDSEIKNWA